MFEEKLTLVGKTPRAVQTDYCNAVASGLSLENKVSLIQAETGVGKSLAYCYAGIEKWLENPKARVIIATHTIQLLRDLKTQAVPEAIEMLSPRIKPKVGMLVGVNSYVSQKRLLQATRHFSASELAQYRDELDALMIWDQEIDLYLDEYVELPLGLRPDQICQTAYAQEDWYHENKNAIKESDILLVSHAMLVADVMNMGGVLNDTNQPRQTFLIIDEADAFFDVMESYQEVRINLLDLAGAIRRLPSPFNRIAKQVDVIADEVKSRCPEGIPYQQITEPAAEQSIRDALKAISQKLSKSDDDAAESLRAYLKGASVNQTYRMGLGRTRILNEPDLVFINPFFTRTFKKYATSQQSVVLTSGTLATSPVDERGLAWLREGFLLGEEDIGVTGFFAPEHYGAMQFNLAGPRFPRVFESTSKSDSFKYNKAWVSTAAAHIETLKGNVLVLTSSHEEGRLLSAQIDRDDLLLHKRGEKLSQILKHYQAAGGGVLITAAGKAGMNLRKNDGSQFIDWIVVTRVPFMPPLRTQEKSLSDYLRQSSDDNNPEATASKYFYRKNINGAVRRLKQSLGRGIRDAGDVVGISILDARFPLFNEMNNLKPLKSAIPERFITDYRQATLVGEKEKELGLW